MLKDINHIGSLSLKFISVLDLNAFERQNKAEGLGMVTEEGSSKWGETLDYLRQTYAQ
jgi:hypothetical protein